MTGLTVAALKDGLARVAAHMEGAAPALNEADGRLGDGDLGVTMVRGGREVAAALPGLPDDLGVALMQVAQAFTRISGSTFGTLLAIGLMSAARATRGRSEVPWSEVPTLLGGAGAAMMARSKGSLGDKTVLDAIEAARAAMEGLAEPQAMLAAARAAVAACLDDFRGKPARQGRARIFAEKSVGLDDPGMLAFQAMLEALAP
ncbi:MAG: dihydroxyacetone kinase subunit L [Rhodospirillaceae bacterium]|nr:dihydroxyacetone kinase subunit L [Rhodospirillaceae bacterium]